MMKIVFSPSMISKVTVRRVKLCVATCLVDQDANIYEFMFDDDTADLLINDLFHCVYEERVPPDWDEEYPDINCDVPF